MRRRNRARGLERVALDLAAVDYFLLPCVPVGKRPLTSTGFKAATRDERQILAWWDAWPSANPAIACGASEANVLDIDSKHGADPREVIPGLALENAAIILTGEAPDRSDRYPNSLPGVRGAQVWCRGTLRTRQTSIPGVELRGVGSYCMAPGAIHPSGVRYEGVLPPAGELPEVPDSVARILPPPTVLPSLPSRHVDLSDVDLLVRALGARNGEKVRTLYLDGDIGAYGNDRSRADYALIRLLVFWTRSDAGQLERLMRRSALLRAEWDEPRGDSTWLRRAIDKAIDEAIGRGA